jgi:hypothetical protein
MENPFKSRGTDLLVRLLASERERALLSTEVAQYLTACAFQSNTLLQRAPKTNRIEVVVGRSLDGLKIAIKEAAENNMPGFKGGWASAFAVGKLMKDCGIRIGRNKYHDILADLGYERVGRNGSAIMQESGQRPVLYAKPGVTVFPGAYERAQGYPLIGYERVGRASTAIKAEMCQRFVDAARSWRTDG